MHIFNSLNFKNGNASYNLLIKKLLAIILVIAATASVIAGMLTVQEDELVVIKQFGRVVRIINKPGLYFRLPIIQDTDLLTKKITYYDVQPINIVSSDKMNLIVRNYAVWRITEPHTFINDVQTIGRAEVLIDNAVFSTVRQKLSKLSYEEIIKGISNGKDYNDEITSIVGNQLKNSGIEVLDVRLKKVELTTEEEEAAYEKIKTEREKIAKQYLSMAENEASRIEADADKQAKIIISKANEEAEKIKGKADAEAARIYAASYNKDPEFYKYMRTLESYKKTLKGKTTIVIPIDSPYTKYLIGK